MPAQREHPRRDEARLALVVSVGGAVLFSLLAFLQWAAWGGGTAVWLAASDQAAFAREVVVVVGVNTGFGVLTVLATYAFRPLPRGWAYRLLVAGAVAFVVGVPRVWHLRRIPSSVSGPVYDGIDWISGGVGVTAASVAGFLVADLVRRVRDQEALRRDEAERAARAIADIQSDEASTRLAISDRLHGQVQNALVMVSAGLDQRADDLRRADPALADELHQWAAELDVIREQGVRSLSHQLSPAGADLGVVEAVATLLDKLPPQVSGRMEVGAGLREVLAQREDPTTMADRLVVVYAVEEALTNSIKHGGGHRVVVTLDLVERGAGRWSFEGTVDDDGSGIDGEPELHGLRRHAERFVARGGSLELAPGAHGGTRLSFVLPFDEPVPTES